MPRHILERVLQVLAIGMRIHQHALATLAAQQVIYRRFERLAFNVPQCYVHCGNRSHRHRTPTPIRAAVQILPDIFCLEWVATDQARNHMLRQVGGNGHLAPVQRAIAQAIDSFIRL